MGPHLGTSACEGTRLLRAFVHREKLSLRAAAAALGVEHTTLAGYLDGEHLPRVETAVLLAASPAAVPVTAWDLSWRGLKPEPWAHALGRGLGCNDVITPKDAGRR
jgi:transcriptional regulator with XRE-family HTH domain